MQSSSKPTASKLNDNYQITTAVRANDLNSMSSLRFKMLTFSTVFVCSATVLELLSHAAD